MHLNTVSIGIISNCNPLISGFKQGMKLEAVDKANSSLVCVATINDIIGDWLLIHFDGWDNGFDYWAQVDSPYIHPINWCKSKGKKILRTYLIFNEA